MEVNTTCSSNALTISIQITIG